MKIFRFFILFGLFFSLKAQASCGFDLSKFSHCGGRLKLVANSSPGGNTDFIARNYAVAINELFQNSGGSVKPPMVFVDNKDGASGNIGAMNIANGSADGCEFLVGADFIATNPMLGNTTGMVDPQKELVPLNALATSPLILTVSKQRFPNAKTLSDVLNELHKPHMTYSSPGLGSANHLTTELFLTKAGFKPEIEDSSRPLHLPFRGSSGATAELMRNETRKAAASFAFLTQANITGRLANGDLVAIGSTSDTEIQIDGKRIPSFKSDDRFKNLNMQTWYGLFGAQPRKTDSPEKKQLLSNGNQEMLKVVKCATENSALLGKFEKLGYFAPKESLNKMIDDTIKNYEPVILAQGLGKRTDKAPAGRIQ